MIAATVPQNSSLRCYSVIAVLLALMMHAACASSASQDSHEERFREPVVIDIERGTSSKDIAEELQAKEVISSKWLFLLIRGWHYNDTLMAGSYRFVRPTSEWEAFKALRMGSVQYYPVTIPEGLTRMEITEILAATGRIDKQEFLEETEKTEWLRGDFPEAENLEGFLFPDTYYLDDSSTAEKVVSMMTSRFRSVYEEATQGATSQLEPFEIVVLASMIETETTVPEEHSVVSSVFHNRLRLRMLMQCDPTVAYGLALENRFRGRILLADLKDPHPYNTYVHPGLPPGPIANSGGKALAAAAKPAETDYLYFVAKGNDREHVFSKTLVAHNQAVQAYRRSRGR
ncbi:MAG: endolytic transglycosylase MltG [Bryobacterales bacterium]|nr:endolytic transglycosylase MltG [Bryobacterales bacterium]